MKKCLRYKVRLRMERRDQDTIRNPPHQIRPRCVYLFLNQFASTRASHVPAYIDERGRRPVYSLRRSKVVGIGRKGKGGRGLRRWGESVRVPPLFPVALFSLISYPSSFCAYDEGKPVYLAVFQKIALRLVSYVHRIQQKRKATLC